MSTFFRYLSGPFPPWTLLCSILLVNCGGDSGHHTGINLGQVATLELLADQIPIEPNGSLSLSSGNLLPGDSGAVATIRIINTGQADLEIGEIIVDSEPPETFRLANDNASLSPIASGPYTIVSQNASSGRSSLIAKLVVKRPPSTVVPTGAIRVHSNSVIRGVPEPELIYNLSLVTSPPKLVVVPPSVDFGSVDAGDAREATLTLSNPGGDLLSIGRASLSGYLGFGVAIGPTTWASTNEPTDFTIQPSLDVLPGEQASVRVQYRSAGSGNASAKLVLYSNDPNQPLGTEVPLVANPGMPTPPVVAIEAPDGASGQLLCHLLSEATDDDPLTYTWYWQVADGDPFTTFGPSLTPDTVQDCDRVSCWTVASDGTNDVPSNIDTLILPFGPACDDENLCTDDSCGDVGGCAQESNTAPCPDDNICNGAEVCETGQCTAGEPVDCSAQANPCLELTCNPVTGACDVAKPDGTACSDGDLCNGLETCLNGSCIAGPPVDCSALTEPCIEHVCNSDTGLCNLPKANGTPCPDSDLCNGNETCDNGTCRAGDSVDCSWVTDACIDTACNPLSGQCDFAKPDGLSCDDSNECNGHETCQSGHCQTGPAVDCSSLTNSCLERQCNPTSGVCDLKKADGTSCADSNLCDGAETCENGGCVKGPVVDCSAQSNPCLQNACNPSSGSCDLPVANGTSCSDAVFCNGDESCLDGTCTPGPAADTMSDDFSSSPTTSGMWEITRLRQDASVGSWNAGTYSLTIPNATPGDPQQNDCTGISMFRDELLTGHRWLASFDYKASGGGDGFVFMFYKQTGYSPGLGGCMGFLAQGTTSPPFCGFQAVPGYGLVFRMNTLPGPANLYIVPETAADPTPGYPSVFDTRVADGAWHNVQVAFDNGAVTVALDDDEVIASVIPNPSYSFAGVGFGAGLCASQNDIRIDNFELCQLP